MSNTKKTSEIKKRSFKELLTQRSTRRGAFSLLMTIIFIAAVILLNIVLATVKERHPMYVDVTENALYQLQQETKDSLDEVDEEVGIYVLEKEADFEAGDSNNYKYYIQANRLLHAMAEYSDYIDLHYIDLDTQPTFTGLYPDVDWTATHAALVVCGDSYRAVDYSDLFEIQYADSEYTTVVITKQHVEQAIMSAVVNVMVKDKTKVALLTGQGEQDMTPFTKLLENNAYEVEEVQLLNSDVPDDCEILIIYDPAVDIDEGIAQKISDWLENNGKFGHHLVYFPNDQYSVENYPNLNILLDEYGMAVEYGWIYEDNNSYVVAGTDHYHTLFTYGDDETYTETLRNPSIPVVMAYTMPVTVTDKSVATPLLESSDKSFMFPKGLSEEEMAQIIPEQHALSGAAIGVRNDGTEDSKDSSVIVIGSYDAVTTNYLSYSSYNNAAYFINLFNVITDRDDAGIIIEGKDPTAKTLGITPEKTTSGATAIVFLLPIAVLAAGMTVWFRRRHK